MWEIFSVVALIASVLAGVISFLFTLWNIITTKAAQSSKFSRINNNPIGDVLQDRTISIVELGSYIDSYLGKISIMEYAEKEEISTKVDEYLNRIRDYLGETREEIEAVKPEKNAFSEYKKKGEFDDWYEALVYEAREGETWNALARLRRHIEVTLKGLIERNNIKIPERATISRILVELERRHIIKEYVSRDLRYAVSVANKAIHGDYVPEDQAEEAILVAARALETIKV